MDSEASQAHSVEDMMKQRALAMQGEMAGTGGLGSFVKEPEKKMALGGAVAFGGENGSYVDPKYSRRNPEMLNRFWTYENTPEYEEYKRKYGLKGVLGNAASDIGEGASNLYQNAKGLVAATPEIRDSIAQKYAAESAARNRKMLDAIDWYGTENQPQTPPPAPAPQVAQPQATPAPTAPAVSSVLDKGIPYRPTLSPEAQAYNQRLAAKAAQDQVATKYGTTVPAGGIAQNPVVQQEPAQERKSLADYRKEYMDLAGPNQSLADLKSFLAKQGEEYTEDKKRAPWMALMQAGLATMAGTSPFALANIGAGGMKGLEAYGETQKDLKKAQDRQFDLQAKIGAAQRAEDLAALHYGTESVKFDKAEANKERLQGQHDKTLMDIAKMNNQADIQRANISAEATKSLYGAGGKGTDEQRTVNDLLKAMEDPKAYPNLRGANNEPDILKVRQAASIASGTKIGRAHV